MLCHCLQTTGKRLPEWGFKQLEAVTSKSADVLSSLWYLEELEVVGAEPSEQSSVPAGGRDGNGGSAQGEESSEGGSDGVGVVKEGDEDKTEGEPPTVSGGDASEDAVELDGKGLLAPVLLCSSGVPSQYTDEGPLKPPLPSDSQSEEGTVPSMSFWHRYVMVQGQMFGAHGSMSEHSYGSRPQQWIFLQRTLPYWLDSATNVSC